ncbi:MAG: DUF4129 domain-containing protein [Armatimonadetes bacterium]|nr:DUF4129 domain-containing protein [Armatimonadota bacterium]
MKKTSAWLLTLGTVLCLASSAVWGAELTKEEYARLVARASDELKQAAASDDHRRSQAVAAIELLPEQVDVVVVAGSSSFQTDNAALKAALLKMVRRGPEGMEAAARVLTNLQQLLAVDSEARPEEARAVLASVLAQREFRPGLAQRLRAYLYRLGLELLEWLIARFPGLDPGLVGALASIVGWVIVAVVAALVLYLLARVLGLSAPTWRRAEVATTPEPERERAKTHADWLAEAEVALRAGDYQAALRALHMAALVRLDELGVVSYQQAATDGQLVRQLRRTGRTAEAEALLGLNRLFALAWYGERRMGPTEYEAAHAHWRELEALTPS